MLSWKGSASSIRQVSKQFKEHRLDFVVRKLRSKSPRRYRRHGTIERLGDPPTQVYKKPNARDSNMPTSDDSPEV